MKTITEHIILEDSKNILHDSKSVSTESEDDFRMPHSSLHNWLSLGC